MAGDPGPDATDAEPEAAPSFEILARPTRTFPYDEGVRYEGGSVFVLTPAGDRQDGHEDPAALVEEVLAAGPYRYGDFLDLPMPVYLARDEDTGDVFRVSVRDGRVRLHVLPETGSAGLRAFYERLCERGGEYSVECRTE